MYSNDKLMGVGGPVVRPSHYNTGKIEVIDFINDQKLDFDAGNAVKYICRAGKKDPAKEIEDLEKAKYYLEYKIKRLKGSCKPEVLYGVCNCGGIGDSVGVECRPTTPEADYYAGKCQRCGMPVSLAYTESVQGDKTN